MGRLDKIICDSQADYEDGARKKHMLKRRGAAAATADGLAEAD